MACLPESVCSRSVREGRQTFGSDKSCAVTLAFGIRTRFVLSNVTWLVVSAMAMLCSLGCATISGEKYTYETMPRHLIASVRENPQTVDLTRLASATTNSDILDRGD